MISASIGITFYPTDGSNIEELLDRSQKASEYAQQQGGNRCQIFTFAFNIPKNCAAENSTMEGELHHALDNNELELYYQPKVNLTTNLVVGAEALLRWNHPTMGIVSAGKFINLAEETGLIGSCAVICFYLLVAWFGLRAAMNAPDRFGMLLATGLTTLVVTQAFLNRLYGSKIYKK